MSQQTTASLTQKQEQDIVLWYSELDAEWVNAISQEKSPESMALWARSDETEESLEREFAFWEEKQDYYHHAYHECERW